MFNTEFTQEVKKISVIRHLFGFEDCNSPRGTVVVNHGHKGASVEPVNAFDAIGVNLVGTPGNAGVIVLHARADAIHATDGSVCCIVGGQKSSKGATSGEHY